MGYFFRLVTAACMLVASIWLPAAFAQEVQAIPALTGHVIDATGTLDAAQKAGLEEKLRTLEAEKGSQLVILMVATVQPEDIASYTNRVGNAWKIGRKNVGDGVLLVVAKEDRKVRIEVAKALEGAIPDLAAKRIINESITPRFKTGDYAGGLSSAVDQLAARIRGEALPEPAAAQSGNALGGLLGGFDWMDLAIFLFFAVPIGGSLAKSVFGQKLGSLLTGGVVGGLALLVTASLVIASIAGIAALLFALFSTGLSTASTGRRGRGGLDGGFGSSGGGSFSDGGGFSSGGGGDFGGGGASGDW